MSSTADPSRVIVTPVAPLFVPADRPERFGKAEASAADAVILDLEDAVAAADKPAARANIRRHGVTLKPVIVRVNDAASPWWRDDLAAVAASGAALAMIPKAERPESLAEARAILGEDVLLAPQIETVAGLAALAAILAAPGVAWVAFGNLDFALDLGCEPDWEPLMLARSTLVLASRQAGKPAPLDGVTPDFSTEEPARREAELARRWGFGGKLLIHPRQIAPTLAAFTPDQKTLAWARRVLAASEQAAGAAAMVDGAMIDRPVVERARRALALAARLGAGA